MANITREEKKSLRELKEDKDRIVLTAEKGGGHGSVKQKGILRKDRGIYWHN